MTRPASSWQDSFLSAIRAADSTGAVVSLATAENSRLTELRVTNYSAYDAVMKAVDGRIEELKVEQEKGDTDVQPAS
jgi:hypothetical protein